MGRTSGSSRALRDMGLRALGAAVVGLALTPACSAISPEAGERVAACNNADSNPNIPVDFAKDIRPLMGGAHGNPPCKTCHLPGLQGTVESGLEVSSLGKIRAEGVVVPKNPCESTIIKKLRGVGNGARMPKGGPYWSDADIQLVSDWIAEGALGKDED